MPFLSIKVDGTSVATVSTEGLEVVTVNIGGARIDDEYADLSISGGVYSGEGAANHRIWADQLPLHVGQIVEVGFLATGIQSGAGHTIEELHPDFESAGVARSDGFDLFAEARIAPKLRDGYTIRLVQEVGLATTLITTPEEHGFGFHVLWNNLRPETASVSFGSYTLEGVEKDVPGRPSFRERVPVGSQFRLELVA